MNKMFTNLYYPLPHRVIKKEKNPIKDFLIRNMLPPPTPEEAAKNAIQDILTIIKKELAKDSK